MTNLPNILPFNSTFWEKTKWVAHHQLFTIAGSNDPEKADIKPITNLCLWKIIASHKFNNLIPIVFTLANLSTFFYEITIIQTPQKKTKANIYMKNNRLHSEKKEPRFHTRFYLARWCDSLTFFPITTWSCGKAKRETSRFSSKHDQFQIQVYSWRANDRSRVPNSLGLQSVRRIEWCRQAGAGQGGHWQDWSKIAHEEPRWMYLQLVRLPKGDKVVIGSTPTFHIGV